HPPRLGRRTQADRQLGGRLSRLAVQSQPSKSGARQSFPVTPRKAPIVALVIELTLVRQAAKIIDRSDTELLLGDAERCKDRGLRPMRSDHAPLQGLLLRPKMEHIFFR